jgi:small subunit ribosomal protein S17
MQRFIGLVVGAAMQRTAKVCVERLVLNQRFRKMMRLKKNYLAHDPHEVAVVGDLVSIEYCGKISKRKAFVLTEILKEARRYQHPITGQIFTAPAAQAPARNWKELLDQ